MKITCEFMEVSPKLAQQFLDGAGKNRRMRESRIELYAQMMKRGDWLLTNQGVAFDEQNKLIDGQHRLMAILKADVPVKMLVVRGLKIGTQLVLDQNSTRAIHDQIRLDRGMDCTPQHIAIAKQMMLSTKGGKDRIINNRDVILVERFYMKFHTAIAYVASCFTREVVPGITIAPVMAPLARAYYTNSDEHELLNEFANVLITGFTETRTASAGIALRNYLIAGKISARKVKSRFEIYKKTEQALSAFLKREPMLRLPTSDLTEELFPLPGEVKPVVAKPIVKGVKSRQKPKLIKKAKAAVAL